ncbi:MAG: Ig-like domain-containing protein [Bacilli bacterium]|nr:Ig-like domain-containing protein [Bacilli bacterium]
MKEKKSILLISTVALFALASCGGGKTNTSSSVASEGGTTSQSTYEGEKSIEVLGASTIFIGGTTTLVADVHGLSNDEVIWSSSNESLATVTDKGVVTGVAEGKVTIKATSKVDPTVFGVHEMDIQAVKATSISLTVKTDDVIEWDETSKRYIAKIGREFEIETTILPANARKMNLIYKAIDSSSVEINTVTFTPVENTNRVKVKGISVMDSVTIQVIGSYDALSDSQKDAFLVNFVDPNVTAYTSVDEIIDALDAKEATSLLSAKVERKMEYKNASGATVSTLETTTTGKIYSDASYATKTSKTNGAVSVVNYYQGLYNEDVYSFKYGPDGSISNIIYDAEKKKVSTFMDEGNGLINYGVASNLSKILSDAAVPFDNSIPGLGNAFLGAGAVYTIESSSFSIVSKIRDTDMSKDYDFSLNVNFSGNSLVSYELKATVVDAYSTITLSEKGSDYQYGARTKDAYEKKINLEDYFLQDYTLKPFNEADPNGAFDYSNTDKYSADKIEVVGGVTKYTATYDKAIVLKVSDVAPANADLRLDLVSCASSDPESLPAPTNYGNGLFIVQAGRTMNGLPYTGSATLTFRSSRGVEKSILVEFTKPELKSVYMNFTYGNDPVKQANGDYAMPYIFQGEYTKYFYINTRPDEDIYSFGIDIIDGDSSGLELYKYSDGNEYGIPGWSYALHGLKVGTYRFKLYVKNYNMYEKDSNGQDKIYTIEVKAPLTNAELKATFVDAKATYMYRGSTGTYSFSFKDETTLVYTEKDYNGTRVDEVKYSFSDGKIVVDKEQLLTNSVYFYSLNAGVIEYSKDFSSLNFTLTSEGSTPSVYTFIKTEVNEGTTDDLAAFLNGREFTCNAQVASMMGVATIKFNNGKGTLNIAENDGGKKATFSFSYKVEGKALTFFDVTSSNPAFVFNEYSSYYDEAASKITVKYQYLYNVEYGYGMDIVLDFVF